MGLECRLKVVQHSNFQRVLDGNTRFFYTSLESIVFRVVLCHVFTCGIGKFINRGDGCPLTDGVLCFVCLFQLSRFNTTRPCGVRHE